MKNTLITTLAFIFLAGSTQAQEVAIRSGDHPTFSRLTIPLPLSQPWEAKQTPDGVELSLPGFLGAFDTSEVFVRMRRNRIERVNITGEGLKVSFNCACDASAFRAGDLLVIDIADAGTQLAGPPMERTRQSSEEMSGAFPLRSARNDNALPWIGGNSPFDGTASNVESRTSPANDPEIDVADRASLLEQTQKSLAEEVANAASTGLLENSYQTPEPLPSPSADNKKGLEIEPKKLPEIPNMPSINMRVTSSMDRQNRGSQTSLNATVAGVSCPSEDFLAIQTWGDESGFSAQIGPARHDLMNARDQLDQNAAKQLAQLYLFFGFGAETKSVLRLDPALGADLPQLDAVANILDGTPLNGSNFLRQYTACATDVALWATLSFPEMPSGITINTNATLRALNKLPKHLRQIVAPMLSEKLLQNGAVDAAAAAMRSIERLPDTLTPDALMAQAELAIDAGDPAEGFLEEVIDTNSTQSPEALVKLVEGKLARDEPLSYETATLVEAYAQELRGTFMGNELRKAQVIALSQSQHFNEAFATLEELGPSLSPKSQKGLMQTVFSQLSDKADDLTFLEHVFKHENRTLNALGNQTKLLLASRLMDLGFAVQVQLMLDEIPDAPRKTERQLLAARAALTLRQPFQAQAALLGIKGADAALLLAQAKEMAGSYREASEIFSNNNASEQAAQAAWLSEEWRDLTSSDTPNFGAVATLAQRQSSTDDASLGPLGRADLALEESNTARDTLEQLLSSPFLQVTPKS